MTQGVPTRTLAIACEATDATDPDAQLIELAAVVVQGGQTTGETFHALLDPQAPIPPSGTWAHGHSPASVAGCPSWSEVAPRWTAFAQGARLLVWNADFHIRLLNRAQERAGWPLIQEPTTPILDLRHMLVSMRPDLPWRKTDLMAHCSIPHKPLDDGPLQEAHQLAQLWLATTESPQP